MQLEPDPEKRLKYLEFVEIYSTLTDSERDRYERDYPEEAKTMQSYSARIREEGEQIGKQIGIQLGEANVVLHLLEQRFGMVSDAARRRIEQADPDTLLRWSGRVLTEDSIEDVLR